MDILEFVATICHLSKIYSFHNSYRNLLKMMFDKFCFELTYILGNSPLAWCLSMHGQTQDLLCETVGFQKQGSGMIASKFRRFN